MSAESNSSADADGNILVRPGDRLPLVPRHTGKLVLDYQLTPALDLGGTLIVVLPAPTCTATRTTPTRPAPPTRAGDFIAGSGWIGGYALVNIQGTYHVGPRFERVRAPRQPARPAICDGRIPHHQHLHRERCRSCTDPDDWTNENAVSPGAPFGIWAGVRVHLD